MENILRSLVKIIIIGSVCKTAFVNCNRQFLPPPLPYYPNGNFFVPGFAPPYHEPLPVFYREENPRPPISFQNINPYTPPQLFQQNENYNPIQHTNPALRYSPPQIFPTFHQPYKTLSNLNNGLSFKKPSQVPAESTVRPTETTQKKPAFYATNIIIKEESQSPYYNDDYNKNYHDEDYGDNYSDESPVPPEPCLLNTPYRYFEPPKPDPNLPISQDKYTLCGSYFQPNFGNSLYTVKMPITLLPSRFPPRVEQLIERIQNYFSTYTQQETPKPENQTLTTTTSQPNIESEEQTFATVDNLNKNNFTEGTQEPNSEPTNVNPTEIATEVVGIKIEKSTPKTIIATITESNEEALTTAAPNIQDKEAQEVKNRIENIVEMTTIVTTTTEACTSQGEPQLPKAVVDSQAPNGVNSTKENQNFIETKINTLVTTAESVAVDNRPTVTPKEGLLQFNITHSNG